MQRCESGSPFDAFNLPNESIPQAGLRRLACDCMAASPKLPRLFLSAGLENVLRMSPTRSLLHLLGRGAGPVIRRVWTLTCDRETRRPRPRRDGAKPTGAGAPRHWRSGILWLAAAERNCVAVALGSGTLCKTGFPARGSSVRVALLGVLAPLCSPCTQLRRRTS